MHVFTAMCRAKCYNFICYSKTMRIFILCILEQEKCLNFNYLETCRFRYMSLCNYRRRTYGKLNVKINLLNPPSFFYVFIFKDFTFICTLLQLRAELSYITLYVTVKMRKSFLVKYSIFELFHFSFDWAVHEHYACTEKIHFVIGSDICE